MREDYSREEITEYAHGVLFGNAYRLGPLQGRPGFFTPKCKNGAERSKVALVRTPDLFIINKYLKENNDLIYAKQCRNAIINAKGIVVQFPKIPIE